MELWSKGVRAPASSPALVGLASLLSRKSDTRKPPTSPKPCEGCGGGFTSAAKTYTPYPKDETDLTAAEVKALMDGGVPVEVNVKAEGGVDKNRGEAEQLRHYWVHGEGAAKIGWGTPGDFLRCVGLVSEHMTEERAKGYCNLRHQDALGVPPGQEKTVEPNVETKTIGELLDSKTIGDVLDEKSTWNEQLHPRVDDGKPGGGRFSPKNTGDTRTDVGKEGVVDREELSDEDRKALKALIDDMTGGGDRQDLTSAQQAAIRKIVDRLVEPINTDSDAPPKRPFQDASDGDRATMRDMVDRMTGNGRFKDLPEHARAALRRVRNELADDAKAKDDEKPKD